MNDDFKLKKTRMIVVASIFWLAFSFYEADTAYHSGLFDFYNVKWETFFLFGTPVWMYWAYYWINKGR